MRQNLQNLAAFLVLAVGGYFLLQYAEKNWVPKPPNPAEEARKKKEAEEKRKAEEETKRKAAEEAAIDRVHAQVAAGLSLKLGNEAAQTYAKIVAEDNVRKIGLNAAIGGYRLGVAAIQATKAQEDRVLSQVAVGLALKLGKEAAEAKAVIEAAQAKLENERKKAQLQRGELIELGDKNDPQYNNYALLTTRGGGIQQVILPKFTAASRLGKPREGMPLYLIPGVKRERPTRVSEQYPEPDLQPGPVSAEVFETLAEPAYTIFHYPDPDAEKKYPDPKLGREVWDVVENQTLEDGTRRVVFEKSLDEGFDVTFRKTFTLKPGDYHIGFQLEITADPPEKGEATRKKLRYQLSGPRGLPLEGEWYTWTHRIALIGWKDEDGAPRRQYETSREVSEMLGGDAVNKQNKTFQYMAIATQFFTSAVAIDDTAPDNARNPWSYVRATTELPFGETLNRDLANFSDITVRAVSDTLDLTPGETRTHKFVIYNGPAKVSLLGYMEGNMAVDQALVDRYTEVLGLQTITDFHSPTWIGRFADAIYWADLVITFTNVMHWMLASIHSVVPDWALCIVVLTIIVRLVLLYPSRRQTMMQLRMVEIQKKLAPQLEDLKKKYPNDFHGYNRAKMQLMMAHGFNPAAQLGGCLLLFLQMPIMMGLYFCLQESVFFRLEHFLWIDNLAAPDMTVWWGEGIPYISTPDNIGAFYYFGPFLNILPILAVVLMFGQMLATLPPPTDEQSRQQRTMMKMMMFLMPLFFYKFAAGLALYFIIGALWGMAERKLIPKPDLSKISESTTATAKPTGEEEPPKPKGFFGRMKERVREAMEEAQRRADEQARRQIRNDRDRGGGSSPASGGGSGGGGSGPPRRDKKKRKRK